MKSLITPIFQDAMLTVFGEQAKDFDPLIQTAARPEFGDYQANFAMSLGKRMGKNPRDLAQALVPELQKSPAFSQVSIAGPGFINVTIANTFLQESLMALTHDARLGVKPDTVTETVVVDYANANVAKEMHVGHIRSIVIGDAIVRLLEFLGHNVIRQSHLGDWGTQFGMLIENLSDQEKLQSELSVTDMDAFYKQSKKRFDEDPEFADRARLRVVSLQQGDVATLAIWENLVKQSLGYFQIIYNKLDVSVKEEHARGESFYNPYLADVIRELKEKNLAIDSEGAVVVPLEDFDIPYLIQKKDGGYLYSTTDLAAARFRMNELNATRLIYLTDVRQKQHFAMLFATLKKADWIQPNATLTHIPFGTILGPDNKPFKTREGESIRLISLLEEAESRAYNLAKTKNPDATESDLRNIATAIGIGALKYADLRADKIRDYVFDWDKLLAFEGNTAPYLQNAYVRIQAIFRKGKIESASVINHKIILQESSEHQLAIVLLQFSDLLHSVSQDLNCHRLCDYLYDLASTYHSFYENCPILSTADDNIRQSRILISLLTAKTLKLGLSLLGIATIDQM